MGDYADMMLDGTCCAGCGVYLGDDMGVPVYCKDCRKASGINRFGLKHEQPIAKAKCPTCGRKVKHNGLKDHMRDAHGAAPTDPQPSHTMENGK